MPPEIVESIEQLIENALRFDSYRTYGPGSGQRKFWEKTMKRGKSFLHLVSSQDENIFCPGRFLPYQENTWERQRPEGPGDYDSSRRVTDVLNENPESRPDSNRALRAVFENNGLEFSERMRQFWLLEEGGDRKFLPVEESIGSNLVAPQFTMTEHPLNRIFYGPPGTGKTYHTVNAALAILDPNFDESKDRRELMNRFKELKSEGRIEFVTFHQSFSYEEFVEGLKATTTGDGQIFYDVKDGAFKRLCERADAGDAYFEVEQAIEQLKEECLENAIEMETISWRKKIKVHYNGNTTFGVEPLTGKSKYIPAPIDKIKKVLLGTDLSKSPYDRSVGNYVKTIAAYITQKSEKTNIKFTKKEGNYVMVIDEINRGNISRIFGELITLIEPSKRAGETDALSVTLPYSQESFSVPKNLYIIGTMNTADRSIALLDTALRRRFHFEEMMPNLELLDGVNVEGVEIRELLSTMNERIEALYDRDHQIGHAYFLPLKENPSLTRLSDIFRHSVLPLLQEYFYEDWEKIAMVLGKMGLDKRDLGKEGFLKCSDPPKELDLDNGKKLWRVDENAFSEAENYRKVYGG